MGSSREPVAEEPGRAPDPGVCPGRGCSNFMSGPTETVPPADEPLTTRRDVNCATTCNAGSCRAPGESPHRLPAHRQISYREHIFEETDQVWTEAGFLPPADCRRAVALLHRLAMDEEPAAPLLSSALTSAVKSGDRGRGYRVFDPTRLRRTALEYGIDPAGGNSTEVARAVTRAIIAEYGEKP